MEDRSQSRLLKPGIGSWAWCGRKTRQLVLHGIEPLLGTLADLAKITESARAADAVINAANADDFLVADTLLKALAESGKPLIHTSGTSVVSDRAAGEYSAAIFYEDSPFDPLPHVTLFPT